MFGLPYTGSKNRIAKQIIDILPPCDNFIDVFAGGCAVSHCATLSNKYKNILINDIQQTPQIFLNAINDQYVDFCDWISREQFFASKDIDLFIALIYSFGNNLRTYLFNPELERYKKAIHYAVYFDDFREFNWLFPELKPIVADALQKVVVGSERRLTLQSIICKYSKYLEPDSNILRATPIYKECSQGCCNLVQHMARVERINDLSVLRGHKFNIYNQDYKDLKIPRNSVIYCDPPYSNHSKGLYNGVNFNAKDFLEWCVEQSKFNDVYVSEYNIDDNRFECVAEIAKICKYNGSKQVTERVFKVKR